MREAVLRLSQLLGIASREGDVRSYILQELKNAPAVCDVRVDRLGNVIVSLT